MKDVSFKLLSHPGKIEVVTHQNFNVPAEQLTEGTLFIEISSNALQGDKDKLKIGVYSGDRLLETATTRFLGPRNYY